MSTSQREFGELRYESLDWEQEQLLDGWIATKNVIRSSNIHHARSPLQTKTDKLQAIVQTAIWNRRRGTTHAVGARELRAGIGSQKIDIVPEYGATFNPESDLG
jgi:hypothetical protein